ncbi:MAG: antibiotic biosynthesis monooxygenase [Gammaproteobacteria bacterium]|nr:antibiotic biosynthesis monooxygenase [Gammaproteobacteria bacterium]
MFVVANRVHVAEEWCGAFEERFRRRAGQIDRQPGFVRMEVLRPKTPGAPYVVLTAWREESDFRAWVHSDDFRVAHADPLPAEAFAGEGRLEQYEVIVSSSGEKQ